MAAAPASLRSALLMLRKLAKKQVVVKGPDGVRIPKRSSRDVCYILENFSAVFAGSKTKLKLADSIPETRRKIREMLEKLREKAGVLEKTKPNPKNQDSPSENPEK